MAAIEYRGNRRRMERIMRKTRKKRRNIAAVEKRKRVDRNQRAGEEIVLDGNTLGIFQQQKRGPGRPKRYIPDDLLVWRDRLVWFLANNWPELKPIFRRPKSPAALGAALSPYEDRDMAGLLMAQKIPLFEFLTSGRYHGDPRQIANAMAGADTLSWRRSLDICGSKRNQCKLGIGEGAFRDFMDRKFHDRFLRLRRAEKLPEPEAIQAISAIMRGTRTHHEYVRYLRDKPQRVVELMRNGKPRTPDPPEPANG